MIEMVVGFVFYPSSLVYLIRKKRPDWQAGKLNGIGGHVELGEDPYSAMSRECFEEGGLFISEDNWEYICYMEEKDFFALHVFATIISSEDELKTMTDEEIVLLNMNDLITAKTIPNAKFLVPMAWEHLTNKHSYKSATFQY
jgi:8-oxo-dGTP diphosphatase